MGGWTELGQPTFKIDLAGKRSMWIRYDICDFYQNIKDFMIWNSYDQRWLDRFSISLYSSVK